jgi:CDP-glycerol glycerophosphotransferase (TagB/SpsB family)
MLCAVSPVKVSTHIMGFTPSIEKYYMLDKINAIHGKKIFLQHGIIKEDIAWYHYPNVKPDLFICSLPVETEFVKEHFRYPEGVVQCAGLCRFDALNHRPPEKRQILIMPTWRKYAVEGKSREEFEHSEYFKRYQALLECREIGALLETYDYRIIFYPHYEVQKFISSFHTENDRIEIGLLGQYDVQQLLMESAVLISDFSSVHFDFAYMEKAVIYYQFDQEAYYLGHYEKGYFDFEEDGFGPVVKNQERLVEALDGVLGRGAEPEKVYDDRIHQFFPVMDSRNCERNYQSIISLLRKKS